MNNKEVLQNCNAVFGERNDELTKILNLINTLPEKENSIVGQPELFDSYSNTSGNGYFETTAREASTTINCTLTSNSVPNIALVYWYTRGNYTLSDNVKVIYESDVFWHNNDPTASNQRICVGYIEVTNVPITINIVNESELRFGLGYTFLSNAGIPEVVDAQYIGGASITQINLDTDNYLNLHIVSSTTILKIESNTNGIIYCPIGAGTCRIGAISSRSHIEDARLLSNNSIFWGGIVKVRCPVKSNG